MKRFRRRKQWKPLPGYPEWKMVRFCAECTLLIPSMISVTTYVILYTRSGAPHHLLPGNCGRNSPIENSGGVHSTWLTKKQLSSELSMKEASISDSPDKIFELFTLILIFLQVAESANLWMKYWESVVEDIKRQMLSAEIRNWSLTFFITKAPLLRLLWYPCRVKHSYSSDFHHLYNIKKR